MLWHATGMGSCLNCGRKWGSPNLRGGKVKLYCRGQCKTCYDGGYPVRKTPQKLTDPELHRRFWSKVSKGKSQDCWNWQASKGVLGYGQFAINGKPIGAHRAAWALTHGRYPTLHICHSCDNPSCVNPDHLWEGTASENHMDRVAKGRHPNQRLDQAIRLLVLIEEVVQEGLVPPLQKEIEDFLNRERLLRVGPLPLPLD